MTATLTQTDRENRVRIDGHAGDDAVCSAVSMAAQSFVAYLQNAGEIEISELMFDSGKLRSTVKRNAEADILHRQLAIALSLVERKYPERIALHID